MTKRTVSRSEPDWRRCGWPAEPDRDRPKEICGAHASIMLLVMAMPAKEIAEGRYDPQASALMLCPKHAPGGS